MVREAAAAITKSTPVSIAMAVALCGGAFWTGSVVTRLSVAIESQTAIINELRSIATDNKTRLDILETQFKKEKN